MTKKELQAQVDYLKARISFLESLLVVRPNTITSTWITACEHEYPNPWLATIPPSCKKCGIQAPSMQITCNSSIAR